MGAGGEAAAAATAGRLAPTYDCTDQGKVEEGRGKGEGGEKGGGEIEAGAASKSEGSWRQETNIFHAVSIGILNQSD